MKIKERDHIFCKTMKGGVCLLLRQQGLYKLNGYFHSFVSHMLLHTLFSITALFFTLASSAALPNLLNSNTLKNKLKLFTGLSTYYEVGPGSCGEYDDDSELVVALNTEQMNNGIIIIISFPSY